jgi:hypothetical protein
MFDGDYPFWELIGSMLFFFAWFIWFWMVITIFADLFKRRDVGGGSKVLWSIFIIVLPFIGVLVYLLVNNQGMAERAAQQQAAMQSDFDNRVRSVAGGSGDPTTQIATAKRLLDEGAISQDEYSSLKRKALG